MTNAFDALRMSVILRRPRSGSLGSGRLEGPTAGAAAEPLDGAGPGEGGEALLRGHAVGNGFVGVFVAQLVEAEMSALDDFQAARQRLGIVAEQARHLGGRLQMALG